MTLSIVLITPFVTSDKLGAFIGGPELIVIAVVGVMVFGSRFPEDIRQIGKLWFKLRRTMNDIKRETGLEQTFDELRRDADPFSPGGDRPIDAEIIDEQESKTE